MWKKLLLLSVSAAAAFIVLEVGVRIWDPNGSIRLYEDHPEVGRIYKPNLDVSVRADDGSRTRLITNRFGFIGPDMSKEKPDGVIRIANHGDSFTSGHDVLYENKYVTVLGNLLSDTLERDVESLNSGIPSQGTQEAYLHYVYRARDFDPDAVVLYFFLGNDFEENLESIEALEDKYASRNEGSLLRRTAKKSELILYLLNRFVQIPAAQTMMYRLGIIRGQDESIKEEDEEEKKMQKPEIPPRSGLIFTPHDPDNERAVAMTTDHLTRFKRTVVDEDGLPFIVVMIPRHEQVETRVLDALLADYPDLTDLGYDPDRPNEVLAGILDDLAIDHLDLTPFFRNRCADECTLYICDRCHLSNDGHRLVAELTAEYLLENVFNTAEYKQ